MRSQRGPNKVLGVLKGHTAEVCGLKRSPQGTVLASGGNDNLLNIWDNRYVSTNSHTTDPGTDQPYVLRLVYTVVLIWLQTCTSAGPILYSIDMVADLRLCIDRAKACTTTGAGTRTCAA